MTTLRQIPQKKRLFLTAFAETGNVSRSAAVAGVDRSTPARWRESDTRFAAQYAEAEVAAVELLEAEARRRAVEGVDKPVYQGGQLVGVVREYSDTLLMFLLNGAAPEKYRRYNHQVTGKDGGPVEIRLRVVYDAVATDAIDGEATAVPDANVAPALTDGDD